MVHLVYVACLLLGLMCRAAFVEIIALIFHIELSCFVIGQELMWFTNWGDGWQP